MSKNNTNPKKHAGVPSYRKTLAKFKIALGKLGVTFISCKAVDIVYEPSTRTATVAFEVTVHVTEQTAATDWIRKTVVPNMSNNSPIMPVLWHRTRSVRREIKTSPISFSTHAEGLERANELAIQTLRENPWLVMEGL